MHYFFIETAQQFVFAKEVAKSLELRDYKLINLTFNKVDRDRITKLREEESNLPYHDFGIDIRNLSSKKKFIVDLVKLLILWFFYIVRLQQNDSIYVACYFKPYFWVLLNSQKISINLYDDGIKTLLSEAKYESKILIRKYNPFRASFKYLFFLFPKNLKINKYRFYTFFEAKGENFEKLKFNTQINKCYESNLEEVWFVGQPLINLNKIDIDLFNKALGKIQVETNSQKIVYFPHPKEKDVEKYFKGEVRRIDKPFELYINDQKVLPKTIISFYSTSLILAKVFNEAIKTKLMYIKYDESENIQKLLEIANTRYNINIISII